MLTDNARRYTLRLFRVRHGKEHHHAGRLGQSVTVYRTIGCIGFAHICIRLRALCACRREQREVPVRKHTYMCARVHSLMHARPLPSRASTHHGSCPAGLAHRPAVYLQHPLMDSSAGWVVMGPGRGLAFVLADAGGCACAAMQRKRSLRRCMHSGLAG